MKDAFGLENITAQSLVHNEEEHEALLDSFVEYACNGHTLVSEQRSDDVCICINSEGVPVFEYKMVLTVQKSDGTTDTEHFVCQIALD